MSGRSSVRSRGAEVNRFAGPFEIMLEAALV